MIQEKELLNLHLCRQGNKGGGRESNRQTFKTEASSYLLQILLSPFSFSNKQHQMVCGFFQNGIRRHLFKKWLRSFTLKMYRTVFISWDRQASKPHRL